MTVPYTFAGATAPLPLSQLDSNFATPITLGNTAITLGNTVTTLNNMTLANVVISAGTIGNVAMTNATATTQTSTDNTINVATTAFVQTAITSTTAFASLGAPQSIVYAPTSSGVTNFLPSTSGTLSITSQNVSTSSPFVVMGSVSAPNAGTGVASRTLVGISTSNLTWSSLTASATNYLYVDISTAGVLTPNATTSAPIYTQTTTPSTTSGVNTFVIPQMQMYAGNGSAAVPVYRVFVGEAVTSGSAVTSTVAYNTGTTFQSAQTSTLPSAGTQFSATHNLGVIPRISTVYAVNLTAEAGYSIGDTITPYNSDNTGFVAPFVPTLGTHTALYIAGSNTSGPWRAQNKSTGADSQLTNANWAYYIVVQRGW